MAEGLGEFFLGVFFGEGVGMERGKKPIRSGNISTFIYRMN